MLLDGIVGLGGVISKPYRGALKHGPRGFAKGLGQGALCVRLAQEPSRCLRWGAPGSAGRCWPMPRGGRARVS